MVCKLDFNFWKAHIDVRVPRITYRWISGLPASHNYRRLPLGNRGKMLPGQLMTITSTVCCIFLMWQTPVIHSTWFSQMIHHNQRCGYYYYAVLVNTLQMVRWRYSEVKQLGQAHSHWGTKVIGRRVWLNRHQKNLPQIMSLMILIFPLLDFGKLE